MQKPVEAQMEYFEAKFRVDIMLLGDFVCVSLDNRVPIYVLVNKTNWSLEASSLDQTFRNIPQALKIRNHTSVCL